MTLSEYVCKVTAIVDGQTGGRLVYPENFESDVEACFQQRLTPEQAAEKFLIAWLEMDTNNYSLTDVDREHFWTGSGFIHKDDVQKFDRIAHYTRQEALAEKARQKKTGIHLRLCK